MNKYKLVREAGTELKRLVALRDFGKVKKGELGGLVLNRKNLSQEGTCWIGYNAEVIGEAKVIDNAQVYDYAIVKEKCEITDSAKIYGHARILGSAYISNYAEVYGDAYVNNDVTIYGNARVYGKASVYEEAQVYGYAEVCEHASISWQAQVYGKAKVSGRANVYGNAIIAGDAKVTNDMCIESNVKILNGKVNKRTDYMVIGPIGSEGRNLTCVNGKYFATGCFSGTKKEFLDAVKARHKNNKHALQYREMVRVMCRYTKGTK